MSREEAAKGGEAWACGGWRCQFVSPGGAMVTQGGILRLESGIHTHILSMCVCLCVCVCVCEGTVNSDDSKGLYWDSPANLLLSSIGVHE